MEYSAYLEALVPYDCPNPPQEPDLPREPGRPGPHNARPDQARHTPRITTPSRHRATSKTAPLTRPRRTRLRGLTSEPPQHQRIIVVAGPGADGGWKRGERYRGTSKAAGKTTY